MNSGTAHQQFKRFSADDAEDKVGRRVRLREQYLGIPEGTSGTIAQADEIHPDFYDLLVEWETPAYRSSPCWFTQDEFERLLEEC